MNQDKMALEIDEVLFDKIVRSALINGPTETDAQLARKLAQGDNPLHGLVHSITSSIEDAQKTEAGAELHVEIERSLGAGMSLYTRALIIMLAHQGRLVSAIQDGAKPEAEAKRQKNLSDYVNSLKYARDVFAETPEDKATIDRIIEAANKS